MNKYSFIIIIFFSFTRIITAQTILFNNEVQTLAINYGVSTIEDVKNNLTIEQVRIHTGFLISPDPISNFGISESTYWLRFQITNTTSQQKLLLNIQNPVMDEVTLYCNEGKQELGEIFPFKTRTYSHQNYLFDLNFKNNKPHTFYLKVKSTDLLQLPMEIGTVKTTFETLVSNDLIFGTYIGIIIVMILYNLFIYFTVKDSNYIYYVIYISTVGLTQACLQGYAYKYLWPVYPFIAKISTFIIPALSGIAVALFTQKFLSLKKKIPPMNILLNCCVYAYIVSIALALGGFYPESLKLIQLIVIIGSVSILTVAIILSLQNDRQAKYFLISWSIFLLGLLIFVLKNLNILPYNNFTNYTMQAGSALEVILLSFALADKINIFKKEKEESQLAMVEALKANEKLILEQNQSLEYRVKERTHELENANHEITITLDNLKKTQSKLVESEKMASLGQLTAGIAHEINNPINFVSSSVTPLKRDIQFLFKVLDQYNTTSITPDIQPFFTAIHTLEKKYDMPYLKEEIETIIKGIEDGASRTTEIVRGLKNFSRLDEGDLKTADLNEGLNSTLILLNNKMSNITLTKELGKLPMIECYAGKLNQVFMNILSNSIDALETKTKKEKSEIRVSTQENGTKLIIKIWDNGDGIPKDVASKIFDPFFTTKDVGKGTGLGLSIVYSIIENHQGEISVHSEPDFGTEFIIKLPKVRKVI